MEKDKQKSCRNELTNIKEIQTIELASDLANVLNLFI